MALRLYLFIASLIILISLSGFKPPKTSYPQNDILYKLYGGDVDKMMREERRKDSIARPFLYKNFGSTEEVAPTSTIDDESVILERAEIMPLFPDGEQGLKDYILSGIVFLPDTLVGKKATVIVKFYINTLGDVKNPVVVKSNNPSFDVQAVMLVDGMPKWIPAKQNGKEVNCYVTLPIKYNE